VLHSWCSTKLCNGTNFGVTLVGGSGVTYTVEELGMCTRD
jgi:hypothetical protein